MLSKLDKGWPLHRVRVSAHGLVLPALILEPRREARWDEIDVAIERTLLGGTIFWFSGTDQHSRHWRTGFVPWRRRSFQAALSDLGVPPAVDRR